MGSAATSNALGQWGGAQRTFGTYGNQVADLNDRTMPEQNHLDFGALDKSMELQGIKNTLTSRRVERETSPQIADARQELQNQVLGDLKMDAVPPMLQRQLMQAGIGDAISSGMGVGSTSGKSILANILGKGFLDYRNQNQQKASALLSGNPLPTVGLDPSSLGSSLMDQNISNLNLRNSLLSNQNSARSQRYSDSFNGMQQMMGATAQDAQNTASAVNTKSGQTMGAIASTIGAIAAAAGAVAL